MIYKFYKCSRTILEHLVQNSEVLELFSIINLVLRGAMGSHLFTALDMREKRKNLKMITKVPYLIGQGHK